ncbi:MAG TPA: hypothetical protein PLG22_17340 [Kiritimatiellia bacterium]|nr:hypothetical protein [Kiritimatiellia bacterium]
MSSKLLTLFLSALVSSALWARPQFDKSLFTKTFWALHQLESITYAQTPACYDRQLTRSCGDPTMDNVVLAHRLSKAGVKGVFLIDGSMPNLDSMLKGFEMSEAGVKVSLTAGTLGPFGNTLRGAKGDEAVVAAIVMGWTGLLGKYRDRMLKHPAYARCGGRPVVSIYQCGLSSITPKQFAKAMEKIERDAFPCVWVLIADCRPPSYDLGWMEALDGLTYYSPRSGCDLKTVEKAMRERYPGKVHLPTARPKHQGADYGETGRDVGLFTGCLRRTFKNALETSPEAICLNELAEFQEQSHVVPSYQLLDTYWRICGEYSRLFRGLPLPDRKKPELFLTARKDIMLGDSFECEVLAFAMPGGPSAEIDLRLLNERGEEVFVFPKRTIKCDGMRSAIFSAPTDKLVDTLALTPVLRYRCAGEASGDYWFRPTRIWVGNVASDEMWSTPIDCASEGNAQTLWLWGIGRNPNFTVVEKGKMPSRPAWLESMSWGRDAVFAGGVAVLKCGAVGVNLRHSALTAAHGLGFGRLLVNGWSDGISPEFGASLLPPVRFLEWERVNTEIVSLPCVRDGKRSEYVYEQPRSFSVSLPITLVSSEKLLDKCDARIAISDAVDYSGYAVNGDDLNAIGFGIAQFFKWPKVRELKSVKVPKWRVPFFDYRFTEDTGGMAVDYSGYGHHGWLGGNGSGTGPGTAGSVDGYSFQNFGWDFLPPERSTPKDAPRFVRDGDGVGAVRFDGTNSIAILPARTQAPFAQTVEMEIKPDATGRKMILAASGGHDGGVEEKDFAKQRIGLTEDLHVFAHFPGAGTAVTSQTALASGEWSKVALVDDGERATVFVNGRPVAKGRSSPPNNRIRTAGYLVVGFETTGNHCYSTWYEKKDGAHYSGLLRRIRVTARALRGEELL